MSEELAANPAPADRSNLLNQRLIYPGQSIVHFRTGTLFENAVSDVETAFSRSGTAIDIVSVRIDSPVTSKHTSLFMLRNYLKIAWRNLTRNKTNTFINVVGLAMGLAACLLLLTYLQNELSYDAFHAKADRIARVTMEYTAEGQVGHVAETGTKVAPELARNFSEIEAAARLVSIRQRDNLEAKSHGMADRERVLDPAVHRLHRDAPVRSWSARRCASRGP